MTVLFIYITMLLFFLCCCCCSSSSFHYCSYFRISFFSINCRTLLELFQKCKLRLIPMGEPLGIAAAGFTGGVPFYRPNNSLRARNECLSFTVRRRRKRQFIWLRQGRLTYVKEMYKNTMLNGMIRMLCSSTGQREKCPDTSGTTPGQKCLFVPVVLWPGCNF